MRAAIYTRRPTDEDREESLEIQLGRARQYVESKGWRLDEAHVYVGGAVSRAEFVQGPALSAMFTAAREGAFDVVVVRDETRLGGDAFRTARLIRELLESGTRLVYYHRDEEVLLGCSTDSQRQRCG